MCPSLFRLLRPLLGPGFALVGVGFSVGGFAPALAGATPPASLCQLYVAAEGVDAAPGTAAQPVASLARAQSLARAALRSGQAVHITVREGVYYLPAPLVFTPEDGGTAAAPAVWQAAANAVVVVSGGARLDLTWEVSALRPGVRQARVPLDLAIDQLWINDRRQDMARFPNRETGAGRNVFDTWILEHRARPDPDRDPLAPNRLARWADPTGAYLHGLHPALWGGVHWRVTGRQPDGTLALAGGTQNNRGAALHPTYRIIEHVREELDAPGEWFHDQAQGLLYFYPPADLALDHAKVEVVRLRHLIEVRGTRQQPVRGLTLRGFTFRHAARTFMETKEPLLRSDWTIYRGGAVLLEGTEDCTLADCTFDQVGGNALFASNYHRRLTLRSCLITDAGANGICFVGDPAAVRNPLFNYGQRLTLAALDRTPGPQSDNYPADCLVEDCLITRTGRVEKQTAGVEIDLAQGITVRHCSIYDLPRAGLNIGNGHWGGHLVEFCDIFDTVLETGDHGAFNSWGRDRFWPPSVFPFDDDAFFAAHRELPFLDAVQPVVLRNNRWRCDHGWDIDLDDGSSNYVIQSNLCLNGGIKNREGFRRIVENNIIVRSSLHPHVWYKHSGDIFRRNIVGYAGYLPARMGPPPWGADLDYNLVHTPGLAVPRPAVRLAQQSGRDAHSLAADAQFIDPAHGDYRVRAGSPALALGFVNFPMDRFGVQSPVLRARARQPSFGPPRAGTVPPPFSAPVVSLWLGARVKSLATIEEASAVGTALADGGVLVLDVPPGTAAARAGLRSGDLLRRWDGQPLKDAPALLARWSQHASAAPVTLTVVRDQAPLELRLALAP